MISRLGGEYPNVLAGSLAKELPVAGKDNFGGDQYGCQGWRGEGDG